MVSDNRNTIVTLTNGVERVLPIHIDDFCTKVFRTNMAKMNNQLIEIDEPEPLSDDLMGRLLRHNGRPDSGQCYLTFNEEPPSSDMCSDFSRASKERRIVLQVFF